MEVYLYSLSKKPNSTKRPTGSGKKLDCVLKAPASILNPVLDFTTIEDNPTAYNYAYIPDFKRYYHINNWTSGARHLWTCDMSVDVLATFKTDIGNQTLYVLRSSYTSDGDIVDTTYPTTSAITYNEKTVSSPLYASAGQAGGSYVVGIINNSAGAVGAVAYYVFTPTEFRTFCNYLLSDGDWCDLNQITDEISEELSKVLFDPFQYVVSCMWFPISVPKGTAISGLPYGWWSIPSVTCAPLTSTAISSFTTSITIPKHPKAASRGNYLNLSPYTRYRLTFLPYGSFELDTTLIAKTTTLYVSGYIDCITGDSNLIISPDAGLTDIMSQVSAKVGVPIQIAQVGMNIRGASLQSMAIAAGMGVAGGVMQGISSGDGLGGSIKSAASNIADSAMAALTGAQTMGSNGNIGFYQIPNISLTGYHLDIVDEDQSHRGRPLCKQKKLNTIPGYQMIGDSDIDIVCYPPEKAEIMAALTGGYFYE